MIKLIMNGSVGALFLAGAMGMASNAVAEDSWGHNGDKKHHGMKEAHGDKKSSWNKSPMGMESGHMTARLRKVWNLDLSDKQKASIRKIQRELRATTWKHEDAIEEVSDKLFDLYKADKRDAKAIGKVYGEIFDHRRQIIEAQIEAGNEVDAQLTKEQRQSLKGWGAKPKWGSGWGQ